MQTRSKLLGAIGVSAICALSSFSAYGAKAPDPESEMRMPSAERFYPYDSIYRGRGIDLVVQKVQFEKGIFGGEEKIRFKVWIRNICNQGTDSRIKVSLRDIGRAIWIEDGISAGGTKASASYYMPVDEYLYRGTRVTVDPDDAIHEIVETNNTCSASFNPARDTFKETICWRYGSHCVDPGRLRPREPDVPR